MRNRIHTTSNIHAAVVSDRRMRMRSTLSLSLNIDVTYRNSN
jgi:hypothetical protein